MEDQQVSHAGGHSNFFFFGEEKNFVLHIYTVESFDI